MTNHDTIISTLARIETLQTAQNGRVEKNSQRIADLESRMEQMIIDLKVQGTKLAVVFSLLTTLLIVIAEISIRLLWSS